MLNTRVSSYNFNAAKDPTINAAPSQRFPGGSQEEVWAWTVTAEDQKGKEEGDEEWGKNWEIRKHTVENTGKDRKERGGEIQKAERVLAFLTAR